MRVDFFPTNGRHHLATMEPVAIALKHLGHSVRFISLAEVRGEQLLSASLVENRIAIVRPVPHVRPFLERRRKDAQSLLRRFRPKNVPSSTSSNERKPKNSSRATLRRAGGKLLCAEIALLQSRSAPDVCVVMNDAAFPGDVLAQDFARRGLPFVLLQEGVRFPLPAEDAAGLPYGGQGAHTVCVWGERSKDTIARVSAPQTLVTVTGTPRIASWHQPPPPTGKTGGYTVGVFTNPIDMQGFTSTTEKFDGFTSFLRDTRNFAQNHDVKFLVRHHPGESSDAYREAIRLADAEALCTISTTPLNTLLREIDAGVVMASSVGLEVLLAGRPLGVMEIPKFGYVHDYVEMGAGIPLSLEDPTPGLEQLLRADSDENRAARIAYVEAHLHFDDPTRAICQAIVEAGRR